MWCSVQRCASVTACTLSLELLLAIIRVVNESPENEVNQIPECWIEPAHEYYVDGCARGDAILPAAFQGEESLAG